MSWLTRLAIAYGLLPLALVLAGVRCDRAPAHADEARPRVEYYDTHGARTTYTVTNPHTGITDVYDAQTSRRLGTFRTSNAVFDTHGKRVDGGLPAVALPGAKGKGGKK